MPAQRDSYPDNNDLSPNGSALPGVTGRDLTVVGVGASAGGLDVFKALLDALPSDTGMAFVFIQHLDPVHASLMSELLASHTDMPVNPADDGVWIEANRVYLIPPGVSLAVKGGQLHLSEPKERHGARKTLDFFFNSLAEDCRELAIGVVLSGTGTDGSHGLKTIKENGGLVIVQKPSEAAFDGMPLSAIQTGCADLVLPVADIPDALIRHVRGAGRRLAAPAEAHDLGETSEHDLRAILDLVRANTRQDFSLYKSGTITRRIARRMAMANVTNASRYVEMLKSNSAELDQLGEDLLIHVTHFFRDTDAFEALAESVIPELVAAQPVNQPLRIWVTGCSTGEEVYSLAILFQEAIRASKRNVKLQAFASDVDAQAITFARGGVYGRDIEEHVNPERLSRFFTREGNGYRVARDLRETIVFTVQDLLADPPFSRLDLISCRNVLIYLRPAAQQQILSLFHFALRVNGVLVLGRSETVGSFSDCFEPMHKKQRVYRHLKASRAGDVDFAGGRSTKPRLPPILTGARLRPQRESHGDMAQRLLIDAYAPASVLINKRHEAVFFSGAVDRYLQITSGEVHRNILVMAREGLRSKLRAALDEARESGLLSLKVGGSVRRDGLEIGVKVSVRPVPSEDLFLISFLEEPARPPPSLDKDPSPEDATHVLQLERELESTRSDLNATIRDLEFANEDLRTLNEEALSVNEEFQSTNEELETSKEELQALNEELTALNAQLHETLEQQRATSADLQNILNSADIATVFLDRALNIRFFTPAAKSLFGVIGVDIGRPLVDLAQRFHDDALLTDALTVLQTHTPIRREIESVDGNWYMRGALPYRDASGNVEGVVITFMRVTEMKAAEQTIKAAQAAAESANMAKSQFLAAASHDLRQPLQTITLLQTMLFNAAANDRARKLVERLGGTVRSMSGLLDKLLDINQLEAGVVRPVLSNFAIQDLLSQVQAEFDIHALNEGLSLRVVPCGLTVRTDSRLLEQILRNMLSNATKYTERGKVLLGCRRRGDSLSIEVWDTGAGIPENQLGAIFDEFHQLENPFKKRVKGLGLGLAIVRRLADLLGAPVTVRSRVGRGSVFAITVKLAEYPSPGNVIAKASDAASREQPERTQIPYAAKILLLEDDADLRDTLSLMLSELGYRVIEARDGAQALALTKQEASQTDLIVADFNLPGENGIDVVASLATAAGRPIPAILLTGDISAATLREIGNKGHVHLYKPVDASSLTRHIDETLRRARDQVPARTIFVVDDDSDVREALRDMLEFHGYRTEIFATGAAFFKAYTPDRIGCLLADARMPGMSGFQVIERVAAMKSSLPIIMITAYGDVTMAVAAMKAGAYDFLEKPIGQNDLIATIERAFTLGGARAKPNAEKKLAASKLATLTERQHEILNLVLSGAPSKNIAADLKISQRTVDNHRAAIMKKLGAKSLSTLIRIALAGGGGAGY